MTDRRVALMHANGEFAQLLSEAVNEYVAGWRADPYSAVVDTQAYSEKATRALGVLRGEYDVIQADELVGNGPVAQAIGWLTGAPVVGFLRGWGDYTNAHGQYHWRLRNRIRLKTAILTRSMDRMASISEALIAGMTDMYPMGGTAVLERPYDVERYASGGPLFTDDRRRVVTVTNLRYDEKADGVRTLLRSMAPLLAQNPDVEYVIAGGGRNEGAIRAECDALNSDRVRMLGHIDDVPGLLASADVFAYVSWLDGAPSTVYEAQAAGLPVVGGDAAGVPEAVGDAGLVCPPTPKGMRAGIRAVLEDDGLANELAWQSERKMQDHNRRVAHDWAEFWEGALA